MIAWLAGRHEGGVEPDGLDDGEQGWRQRFSGRRLPVDPLGAAAVAGIVSGAKRGKAYHAERGGKLAGLASPKRARHAILRTSLRDAPESVQQSSPP